MEIAKFYVAEGEMTLYIKDLPPDASEDNTTVYIMGVPLGSPRVELVAQILRISVANAVSSGKVSVKVRKKDGTQVTATSLEDYHKPKPDEGGKDSPRVTTVSPPEVSRGGMVILQGTNLQKVQMVSLVADGFSYGIRQLAHFEETRVQFKLPMDVHAGEYMIMVLDRDSRRINTTKSIDVQ